MTPVEVIALVFALLSLVKLVVILIDPRIWMKKVVVPIYKSHISVFVMSLFALLVLYYLLQELSIVYIYAAIGFTSLFIGIGFLHHPSEVLDLAKKILSKKKHPMIHWYFILVWAALTLWVLYEIFF